MIGSEIRRMAVVAELGLVRNNSALWDCEAICRMLDRGIPASRFKLSGNSFLCNSIPQINEHICDTLTAVQYTDNEKGAPLLAMPNPTSGVFYVQLPVNSSPVSLSIANTAGVVVLSLERVDETTEVDARHLPGGIYFVKACDGGGNTWAGKIVKR
jgi:hypothetical protein